MRKVIKRTPSATVTEDVDVVEAAIAEKQRRKRLEARRVAELQAVGSFEIGGRP